MSARTGFDALLALIRLSDDVGLDNPSPSIWDEGNDMIGLDWDDGPDVLSAHTDAAGHVGYASHIGGLAAYGTSAYPYTEIMGVMHMLKAARDARRESAAAGV